jgi:hypothetical protein
MSVVYPVWKGNAKAYVSRIGRRTDTYAFFVYLRELKAMD